MEQKGRVWSRVPTTSKVLQDSVSGRGGLDDEYLNWFFACGALVRVISDVIQENFGKFSASIIYLQKRTVL